MHAVYAQSCQKKLVRSHGSGETEKMENDDV